MNTIYGDKYKRVQDNLKQIRQSYEDYKPEYKKIATFNINDGTCYVQNTIRNAVSSGTSSLAICNRLLIRLQNLIKDDQKLRDQLFGFEDMPLEDIQKKVAVSLEHIALLNAYIVDRIDQSIEYTKVMYDLSYLDEIT